MNVVNVIILNSVETKNSRKFSIGYLDEGMRPLVLILPKWVAMLRHLKLKMEMGTIDWCLST